MTNFQFTTVPTLTVEFGAARRLGGLLRERYAATRLCLVTDAFLHASGLLAPALAMGNPVVLVPSERSPLSVTDLYQVLETSDVPSGVVNIVTGESAVLAKTLAEHDGVDAIWCAGDAAVSTMVEKASTGNLKQTWTSRGLHYDLADKEKFEGDYFLKRATQVKNVWVPYGA